MKHDFQIHSWLKRPVPAMVSAGVMMALGMSFCGVAWADRLPFDLHVSTPVETQPKAPAAKDSPDFYAGVKAYREGDYRQSGRIFEALHKAEPENAQYTYYLAITEAQLGRFQRAKTLYEEIITLAPNGKAAALAQKGLDYLPKENELDLPPRFQAAEPASKNESPVKDPDTKAAAPSQSPNDAMAEAMRQGMQNVSPQDWMMMQMMQGQNNGQNNGMMGGGMNPMSWMMMPGMNGANGNNNYDPNIMSNMMMQQMMQGFGMGGDSGGNP